MTNIMLEYENEMLLDVLNNNSLLIAAKGITLDDVILNLIRIHCDPGNLVLVLGASGDEEQFILEKLKTLKVSPLPTFISSESATGERENIYLSGGVFFISSRILVVDFLKNRVPADKITGIIVLKAHNILEKAQDAFALRLYRMKNHSGFINGFSSSPVTFTSGIFKVERIMKTLFVNNLNLWPRFHALVSSTLKERQPEVVELHVNMSSNMAAIQASVLDCVHFCIKEIKRINPGLETEDITVENALSKQFYKLLQLRLDPIWNQLSGKTKQLIADLKTLRSILSYLTQSHCVRLHQFLLTLRSKEYTMKCAGWMVLDAAEKIFTYGKQRLFNTKQELNPEPNPKWKVLTDLLKEAEAEQKEADKHPVILILVENKSIAHQLKEVLTRGEKEMLKNIYHRTFGADSKELDKNMEEEIEETDVITLTQKHEDGDLNTTFVETTIVEDEPKKDLAIIIQPFKKDQDSTFLPQTLANFKPDHIVLYDTDIAAVRQIEIYQRTVAEKTVRVYFLIYGGSVEEQVYLSSLRQEKQAFEKLISEKSTIVLEDVLPGEGLREDNASKKSTRDGGFAEISIPKVIVDMREFRSELPSLLHKRGIDIEPVTLQVGDYIITPEMCIERKSISDLIGSLNSGRLYTQALAMTRYYAKPVLLIEFDENKPFALQGRYYLSNDVSNNDIQAKLQLLTLHFPRLRIVWSPSPFASAQLFHELKEGKEEPCASTAASVGIEDVPLESDNLDNKYNIGIKDFVLKLPGVTSKNVFRLLNNGKSLSHLLTLTQDEISDLLGNKINGELLYNALHKPATPTIATTASNFKARANKNRPFKRKGRT